MKLKYIYKILPNKNICVLTVVAIIIFSITLFAVDHYLVESSSQLPAEQITLKGDDQSQDKSKNKAKSSDEGSKEKATLYVYVTGQVNSAKVVQVQEGARIYECIQLAGGTTEEADLTAINMAEEVTDGQQITVPAKQTLTQETTQEANDGKVSINQATLEQLQNLSGVGEKIAERIIEYRNKNGSFKKIEEIMQVKGIGEKLYEKFKDEIKL